MERVDGAEINVMTWFGRTGLLDDLRGFEEVWSGDACIDVGEV